MKLRCFTFLLLFFTTIANAQKEPVLDNQYVFKLSPLAATTTPIEEKIVMLLKEEGLIGKHALYKKQTVYKPTEKLFEYLVWDETGEERDRFYKKKYIPAIWIHISTVPEKTITRYEEKYFYCPKNHANDWFKNNPDKAREIYLDKTDSIYCPVCDARYSKYEAPLLTEQDEIITTNIIRFYNVDGSIKAADKLIALLKDRLGIAFGASWEFDHLIDEVPVR